MASLPASSSVGRPEQPVERGLRLRTSVSLGHIFGSSLRPAGAASVPLGLAVGWRAWRDAVPVSFEKIIANADISLRFVGC